MHPQPFAMSQSTNNKDLHNLHIIFNQKQIVQSYPINHHHSLIYAPSHKPPAHLINTSDFIFEHQQIDHYAKRQKRFVEDDVFGELNPGQIVENYSMLDERDQIYQPYQNIFQGRGQKPVYINQNMLASSSQNNDVPSRNSSLSSLSEKNSIPKIKLDKSFEGKQFEKCSNKNHVKNSISSTSKKISKKFYLGSSENQMDIENPSIQHSYNFAHHNYHYNQIHNQNGNFIHDENYPIEQKPHIRQQIPRKNAIMNPQKIKNQFPIFKRLGIDDEQQKKERLQKIQKLQQIGCNCKKTKCLKMYCECFNLQIFCNENCNCFGCCNQQSNDQHKKAVLDALTRNPKAFNQVTQKIDVTFNLGIELNQVKKGCKCKKTKCQKKYCECYNIGQACGKFCKCQGCQNC